MNPLSILYRDDYLIAVDKPTGLLVHRSALDRDDDNLLRRLREQTQRYLYPVHRLDKPTSGVLLFALDKHTARLLATCFEQHRIQKEYTAVVRGYIEDSGSIDNPVYDRDSPQRKRTPAISHYRCLARIEIPQRVDRYPGTRYSVVCVQPVTGRRHQIRQHMKHLQHPLIGDTSYGKSNHNRFFRDYYDCRRLLLHAQRLQITHPHTNKPLSISATHRDTQFRRVLEDPAWQWRAAEDKNRLLFDCQQPAK